MARKVKVKKSEDSGKIPVIVNIISIIYYIGAALYALIGILLITRSNALVSYMISYYPNLGLETIGQGALATMVVIMGVLILGFGVFVFFVGRGIWKLRKWARIVVIVLSILGILSAIFSIIGGSVFIQIIKIAIHGFAGGYLLFSEEAKKAFK